VIPSAGDPPTPPRGAAIAVAALAVLFVLHAAAFRFTQDDAYISLQYARNLVEGHGLVFNVGERVEGYSNFAWTLLLALLLRLGLPAMEIARGLGVLAVAGALVVAARFAAGIAGWGGAVGTALLVAACSALALWSTSGMETGFHTLVVTVALVRAFPARPTARTRRVATLLFVLAAFTRPDAPLFFGTWIGLRGIDVLRRRAAGGDSLPAIGRDLALFGALLLPWAAWKLAYYGELLPNTYYAKAGFSRAYVARGLAEAREYAAAYGAWLVAPALALAAARHPEHGARIRRLLALPGAHAVWVVFGAGGDVLPFFRFWLPILPLGCALVAVGAGVVADAADGALARRRGAAVVLVAAALSAVGLARNWGPIQSRRHAMDDGMTRAIGTWLGRHLPPGESVAATPIGAVAYFSRRPVIDMLGLVDREIARRPEPLEGLEDTWKEKKYNAASVLRRRPGAILFSTGVRPSAAGEQALFLYEDFQAAYYALYFRPDPTFRQPTTIYRLREDAPAPPDTLLPTPEREFLEAWCRGLVAALSQRDLPAAITEFETAVRTSPPFFVDALEWWSTIRFEAGDESAVPIMHEVVRLEPRAFLASSRLGSYHLARGELDETERILGAHVALNPYDALAWQDLAQVSWHRGRHEEGLERIERSLAEWRMNPEAWSLRVNLALELGRRDLAEESLEAILRLVPDAEDARDALARLRSGGMPPGPPAR